MTTPEHGNKTVSARVSGPASSNDSPSPSATSHQGVESNPLSLDSSQATGEMPMSSPSESAPESRNSQSSSSEAVASPSALLTRFKSETEKAYNTFLKYLELGPGTTIGDVVRATGVPEGTVKFWSSKFRWRDRLGWINSQAIQKRVEAEQRLQVAAAADWAKRAQELAELEWKGGVELLMTSRQMLSDFVAPPDNLSFGQLAIAMQTGAKMSRHAIERATAKTEAAANDIDALRQQLLANAKKAYGKAASTTPIPPLASAPISTPPSPSQKKSNMV